MEQASRDPSRIAVLHSVAQALAMGRRPELVDNADAARIFSSFSDHAVASQPFHAIGDCQELLLSLGRMQVGIAAMGFFIRGAVTIGDLYHDREVVFGPGLVRAYDLESNTAIYPRIVLDPNVVELAQLQVPFITFEDGVRFLDPFTEAFVEAATASRPPEQMMDAYVRLTGFRTAGLSQAIPPSIILRAILEILRIERQSTTSDRAVEKLNWLIGRLESRVGHIELPNSLVAPLARN
jgi:hypothetical protein